ncbi:MULTISPECIES: hemerythrin domain-containing protein [unclassified Sphingomonas]|uniref:hemerythrin domain-containing protein n=1 Tax=unclassified Sphingomonas TaxID=196159 RepID=UPI00082B0E8A|nr:MULTISPECIES: hemerythrin domain-containing protein [unclassified Sphingomonas]MCH4893512.1 hypothetical protein [Sphingomonas sp. SFZ2018-12]
MSHHSLERLIGDHRRIVALATALADAAVDPDQRPHQLRDAVDGLLEAVIPHLANGDRDIYPRLLACNDDPDARAAHDAIRRFEGAAVDWLGYGAHWHEEAIMRDRAGFAEATAQLIDQLHARMRSENELLYPLALQASAIRLRA